MVRFALLFVLVCSAGRQDAPAPIVFAGPANAKPADLKEAAQALQKRCEDLGMKGIKTRIEGEKESARIVLTCDGALPDESLSRIETLAAVAVARIELCFGTQPLDEEVELYRKREKDPPEGMEFIPDVDPTPGWTRTCKVSLTRGGWLVYRQPRFDVRVRWTKPAGSKGKKERAGMAWIEKAPAGDAPRKGFEGPTEGYYEFDIPLSKALMALPSEKRGKTWLFLDGVCLDTGGALYDAGWTAGKARWDAACAREDRLLGVCINNPMPFALKAVPPAAK
jgi:hypothetical protein